MRPVYFREVALGTVWGVGRYGQMGRGWTWHVERQIDNRGTDKVCGCGFCGRSQPLIQDESSLGIYNRCKIASPWPGAL